MRFQRVFQIGKRRKRFILGKSFLMCCFTLSGSLTFVALILVKLLYERFNSMPSNILQKFAKRRRWWFQFQATKRKKKTLPPIIMALPLNLMLTDIIIIIIIILCGEFIIFHGLIRGVKWWKGLWLVVLYNGLSNCIETTNV